MISWKEDFGMRRLEIRGLENCEGIITDEERNAPKG
jgi:hypothetical protein